MKYKFDTVKLYNKDKLVMKFDSRHDMLSNIFNEIVLDYNNKESWLFAIEDSVQGNSQKHSFGVPGFGAEVGSKKTIIYCDFTDEEMEISTEEFIKISEVWFGKLEDFHKTGKL